MEERARGSVPSAGQALPLSWGELLQPAYSGKSSEKGDSIPPSSPVPREEEAPMLVLKDFQSLRAQWFCTGLFAISCFHRNSKPASTKSETYEGREMLMQRR